MVSGVAALPGGLRQREGRLVPLPERGLELGRAAFERDGRSVAPVPAERPGLRPPGDWQGLDGRAARCARTFGSISSAPPPARSPRSFPVALGVSAERVGEGRVPFAAPDGALGEIDASIDVR